MSPKIRVSALLVLASLAASATGFPSNGNEWSKSVNQPSRDDEIVVVPLERNNPRTQEGVEDDYGEAAETYGSTSPWANSFSEGFFNSMQALMRQLRNQMQEVLRRIPQESFDSSGGGEVIVAPSWDSLPGNSTSTTKVINGHVVTVNETTYKKGSDGSSAVFHIRVVDIKPQQSSTKDEASDHEEDDAVEESVGSKSSSSLSSGEAELPSAMLRWFSQAGRPSVPSSLGHVGSKNVFTKPVSRRLFQPQSEEIPDMTNRIDDGVDVFQRENEAETPNGQVVDLSRDTLINKLMSDQQRKGGLIALHPDVELLEIDNGKVVGPSEDSYLQQKFQKPMMQMAPWETD